MKETEFYSEEQDFITTINDWLWLSKGDVVYLRGSYYIVLFKIFIDDNLEDAKLKIIVKEKE